MAKISHGGIAASPLRIKDKQRISDISASAWRGHHSAHRLASLTRASLRAARHHAAQHACACCAPAWRMRVAGGGRRRWPSNGIISVEGR